MLACGDSEPPPPIDDPPFVPLGVTFSPVGLNGTLTIEAVTAFFAEAPDYGSIVAFHSAWRDSVDSAGAEPTLGTFAADQVTDSGVTLAIGFGWSDGAGQPDLASSETPGDNSWTNAETRADFLAMVTAYARDHQPPYMFLGNEINTYWLANAGADWADWVSEFSDCVTAIHDASPNTRVFTVFQLEHMAGLGTKNGWSDPPHWQLLDDFAGIADGIGFTTYPYFEYETPADIPATYYEEIANHYDGPVYFTELGWLAASAIPYTGSDVEQADFVPRFFALTPSLPTVYSTYLFLNDPIGLPTAFAEIGLRDETGQPRAVDATWRAEVLSR
jgi:hypothetical protein